MYIIQIYKRLLVLRYIHYISVIYPIYIQYNHNLPLLKYATSPIDGGLNILQDAGADKLAYV